MVKIEVNHSDIHKELWEFRVESSYGNIIDVSLYDYCEYTRESSRKRHWNIINRYSPNFRNTPFKTTKAEAYARLPSDWKERVKAQIISQIKFETPC